MFGSGTGVFRGLGLLLDAAIGRYFHKSLLLYRKASATTFEFFSLVFPKDLLLLEVSMGEAVKSFSTSIRRESH